MGAPNVKRILARWPYPEAAVEAYSTAMTAAFGHPGAWELIEKAVDNCAAGEKTDIRALLDALGALSEECGVPSQTLRQLPLISSLDAAEARYRALGLSGEMFRDSFADLLWKTRECFRRFGVWGSAAAAWDWGFFELRIFGIGRLNSSRWITPESLHSTYTYLRPGRSFTRSAWIPTCGRGSSSDWDVSWWIPGCCTPSA